MENIITLFLALLFSLIIIPAGLIFHLITSIKSVITLKWWTGTKKFFAYWILIIYQIYSVVGYIAYHITCLIDMLWNVVAGDLVSKSLKNRDEEALFGYENIRLSKSINDLCNGYCSVFVKNFWMKLMKIIWLNLGKIK